jgi:hypothetical protein
MSLIETVGAVFDRKTFGTNLTLEDGNLLVEDQLFPNRVALIGVTSNSLEDENRPGEYLLPNNEPIQIGKPSDLKLLRNMDPDNSPSEILLSFRNAYDGGARSFEVVILSRSVVQLGDDIDAADTTIPVSTVFTNKVSRVADLGGHPTGNSHFSMFVHNSMLFVAGGERPDTPAAGTITCVALASLAASTDYILFTNSVTGETIAFWFDTTGADTVPAGAATADTVIAVDVSADVSADDVSVTLMAAIEASALPISAYDSGAGTIALESDEAGTLGNNWVLTEVVVNAGFTVVTPVGGSATNSISRRFMKYDPVGAVWSNVLDVAGVALRLNTATRDSGAVRHDTTIVHIAGGMSSLLGAANDTAITAVQVLTFTSAGTSTAAITVGTVLGAAHGEGAWVQLANGSALVFGGNVAVGVPTDRTDTVFTVTTTGVAAPMVDSTKNMAAETRWSGAYYDATNQLAYIYGGETATGAINSTVVWDAVLVDFTVVTSPGSMPRPKYAFATVGINGSGYVLGGVDPSGDSDKIERFDPDNLTWQTRDVLPAAASGGAAVVISNHIYYVDGVQGFEMNIGIGNLADAAVGFVADPGANPFYIQCEWEIMLVTGYTTTRARGRDTDAFVVTRAQRTSTAIAHVDRPDITHDPVALFAQLAVAFEQMISLSKAEYVVMPERATADCPYLPEGSNFAYLAGYYCHAKSRAERMVQASLGIHPPHPNPRLEYTRAEEAAWVNQATDFSISNYESKKTWKIGDGVTDSNGDDKPDTYALFFVKDMTIPSGSPPMESGTIELDTKGRPTDIGKYLMIVAAYGFSTQREYAEKFPSGSRGYMRSGHANYIGMVSVLEPSRGPTGLPSRGFTIARNMPFLLENKLVAKRYITVSNRSTGSLWTNGFTFAWQVSDSSRSDWTFVSTMRRVSALVRSIRSVIDSYMGASPEGPSRTAMDIDIAQKIQNFIAADVVGPKTVHRIEVTEFDATLGHATVYLTVDVPGEIMIVDMPVALA